MRHKQFWLVLLFGAPLPACASLTTEMVEVHPQGSRAALLAASDAIANGALPVLKSRAAADLACPTESVTIHYIGAEGELVDPDFGPWEVTGCGKQTIYTTFKSEESEQWGVQRMSVVVPAPH